MAKRKRKNKKKIKNDSPPDLLFVKRKDLKFLLENKRDHIGNKPGWSLFLSGFLFVLPSTAAEYNDVWIFSGEFLKIFSIMVGLILTIVGIIYMIINKVRKYDHNILYKDIESLNVVHPFSLVAIKDTFNSFPNKFLLYFDEKWKCKFFFSFKTLESENEENIVSRLSSILQIGQEKIRTEYKASITHIKYSVKDQFTKSYEHKLYKAEISEFPSILQEKQFTIEGKKFYWMTLDEMVKDKTIMKVNGDVVDFIKDQIG